MNRDAVSIFLGLAVVSAVGVLGVVAWQKERELRQLRVRVVDLQEAHDARGSRLNIVETELRTTRERAAALERDVAKAGATQQRLEREMRSALESRDVAVSELHGRLTVTILDRILFDTGDATLKPEGMQVLDRIAQVLGGFTNRLIQVFGHTDNVPIRVKYPSNWELSSARAVSAVRYLTEKGAVDPRRLTSVGCGEFQPIAENSSPEGRARNRRIAFVVLPEQFAPTDVSTTNAPPVEAVKEEAPAAAPTPDAKVVEKTASSGTATNAPAVPAP